MTEVQEIIKPTPRIQRSCDECGEIFDLPEWRIAAKFVRVCPRCSEKHAEEDQADMALSLGHRRAEKWAKICPPAFLETKRDMLPFPDRLNSVLAWRYSHRGLVLCGKTGHGKSRCAWELLRREFMSGRSVAVLDCSFGFAYAAKYSSGSYEALRWLEGKMEVDILMLDDVFKVRMTDSVEQALFAIVDHREKYKLPIIATLNDTGETLQARMSTDRGEPLVRRLKGSEIINF